MLFGTESKINLDSLPNHGGDGTHTLQVALTTAIGIIAAICLLFVVIGGLRYILSQGDSSGTAKAKGTIMYALIGLVVVIMAQAIVAFVFGNIK